MRYKGVLAGMVVKTCALESLLWRHTLYNILQHLRDEQ
jgi:hypothetical protein